MPPVFSVLADTSPLSYLKICPDCEVTRLSAPTLCKGRQHPDNVDWWYETVRYFLSVFSSRRSCSLICHSSQCLNNHRPTHTTCKHFAWREDIPKGKPTAPSPCPGSLCKQLRTAKRVNHDCTFGLCAPCCVDVRRVHPEVRACAVSAHCRGAITRGGSGAYRITVTSCCCAHGRYVSTCSKP